jgi:ribosomal 50S subunit-recycling heat shock protein
MRVDKFLKESSVIKRRVVAKEATDTGHIYINQKQAKPSDSVKLGDTIRIQYAKKTLTIRVTSLTRVREGHMYEVIEETYRG